MEGASATFYCTATGNPAPEITWTIDGMKVGSGDTLSFETNRNQTGKYWCSVENGLDVVNASADLDVLCKWIVKLWRKSRIKLLRLLVRTEKLPEKDMDVCIWLVQMVLRVSWSNRKAKKCKTSTIQDNLWVSIKHCFRLMVKKANYTLAT